MAFSKAIGTGLHRAVQEHLAALITETDRPRTGVQVEAAVIARLCAGASPEVSSLCASVSPTPAYHGGMPRRGPQ